jgi:hypothetical protein
LAPRSNRSFAVSNAKIVDGHHQRRHTVGVRPVGIRAGAPTGFSSVAIARSCASLALGSKRAGLAAAAGNPLENAVRAGYVNAILDIGK